jgi:hypothetical protein
LPLEALLGILNSSLFNWLFSTRYYDYEIKPVYLRNCPLADPKDKTLVRLVTRVLNLHEKVRNVRTEYQRAMLYRETLALESEN